MSLLFLFIAGLVAGFVDSIAGGGGMITLPSFAAVLTYPPVELIGTNKIVGTIAAGLALFVYARRGHFDLGRSVAFTGWVGLGSFLGTRVAPHVPVDWFKVFLLVTCPLILWVVWRKDLWLVKTEPGAEPKAHGWLAPGLIFSGLACGFYDGVWGPGGGTFMLLALYLVAGLPLLTAVAASKLANTVSAGVALLSFAQQDKVHWAYGFPMGAGALMGAWIGAHQAARLSARVIRPVLASVVVLLVAKVLAGR